MAQHSPKAKIFCLIHKMDLVPESQREAVNEWTNNFSFKFKFNSILFLILQTKKIYNRRVEELETYSRPLSFRCFQTSIWDETLYKAWSQIVHELILNAPQLKKSLSDFADVAEADEILLFEKTTFLVIYY